MPPMPPLVAPKAAALAWDFAWQYPAGINARNYCWALETSTDLVSWSAVDAGCDTGWLTGRVSKLPQQFWRLKGTR